ncbi:MAG: cytochrome-c peroxidase [Granulosicoccus sp.]
MTLCQLTIRQSTFARYLLPCLLLYICALPYGHTALWPVVSASGRYSMVIDTRQPSALGMEQSWLIRTHKAGVKFPSMDAIEIKGGMPAHRHGLPAEPTWEHVGAQGLRIDSLRFHMPGYWFFELRFRDDTGWDSILVNFEIDANGQMRTLRQKKAHTAHMHQPDDNFVWLPKEQAIIASLALSTDHSRLSNNKQLVSLGKSLFSDKRLSSNGQVSCIDCHKAEQYFTSDQLLRKIDSHEVSDQQGRLAERDVMTIVGASGNPWLNWDGRKSELWSHALLPLEIEAELGNNRTRIAHTVSHAYRKEFNRLLGEQAFKKQHNWPDDAGPFGNEIEKANWKSMQEDTRQQINAVFVNVGKALAAYQTQIQPAPGNFDRYAESQVLELPQNNTLKSLLSQSAQRGLRVFIGDKGRCINCHNTEHFTNHGFERVVSAGPIDFGRRLGAQVYLFDEFNCRSIHSDLSESQCDAKIKDATKHTTHNRHGAFRVPGLRGLEKTAPYMHDGRFPDLASVITHYNSVGNRFGQNNLLPDPGSLSAQDQIDLVEFLLSLGSDYVQ